MRKELTYFIPNAIVIRANDKEVRTIAECASLPRVVFPWLLPPQRPSMGHSEHHRFKREVRQGASAVPLHADSPMYSLWMWRLCIRPPSKPSS